MTPFLIDEGRNVRYGPVVAGYGRPRDEPFPNPKEIRAVRGYRARSFVNIFSYFAMITSQR